MKNTAVLRINCPDRKGLVATVASMLYRHGANIVHADQHQDREAGLFFMRVEWMLPEFDLDAFRQEFQSTAGELHCAIPVVIGNHRDGAALAQFYGIEFRHIPVTPESKSEAEEEQRRLLAEESIDLIVLARYM